MNTNSGNRLAILAVVLCVAPSALAGIAATTAREVGEAIMRKFGKGAAGQTVEEVAEATMRAAAKHGEECVPLLRSAGHAGFRALEEAGERAPDVIRLFARRGDEAVWLMSEPRKLALFLKHGDTAADALLKHPGIADALMESAGPEAGEALLNLSRQSAQRLSMAAADGFLNNAPQRTQLLKVLAQYGDAAMDFVWRNKGPLAVTAVMAAFLADPKPYIDGVKKLVVEPLAEPLLKSVNWTLIAVLVLVVLSVPWLIRSVAAGRRVPQ